MDAPTCKNIVLARVINSMTEFKQIIGRGTRVREDAGKLWFSILDYTGSATRLFADREFDGDPVSEDTTRIDDDGNVVPATEEDPEPAHPSDEVHDGDDVDNSGDGSDFETTVLDGQPYKDGSSFRRRKR